MDIGRRAQRIECGITQFEYLLSPDRLEKVEGRIEPRDLQEHMNMAVEETMALERKLPEAARKDVEMIRRTARVLGSMASSLALMEGKKPTEKAIAQLRKKAKTLRGHMESIWTTARYACSIPRPLPVVAVAGRRSRA